MTPRRELTYAVVGCAAAAGLALFAASRTWAVETVVRAAPLPPETIEHSGGSVAPAVPALALVALAGAGGLLATRSWGRRVVAYCVAAAGLGLTIAAIAALANDASNGWAIPTAVSGAVIAAIGGWAVARAGQWPSLGARYDRAAVERTGGIEEAESTSRSDRVETENEPSGEVANQAMWDAIDRGEDPTKS